MQQIKQSYQVESVHSAKQVGSGLLDVLSTPSLIGFMEATCQELIAPQIEEGQSSVGSHIAVDHLKATAIGQSIAIQATLESQAGRQFLFTIEAYENNHLIGRGEHTRVIVDQEKFLAKLNK